MVFRLETEPVHVVASTRPIVKALFHPQGIKDGYCINGYLRKNAGSNRARAFGGARSDALLIWNVGGQSDLPEWEPDSPYCRYESDINVFVTYPSFSVTREEFRTLHWAYASQSQSMASIEAGLEQAGYTKSALGWWRNEQGPWTLIADDQKWLTKYSVRVQDASQPVALWPIVQRLDRSITDQLDETRSIFASQPDALRLFEQAVEAYAASAQVIPAVPPVFINPVLPFYWTSWPLPAFSYAILHPWQQSFLDALIGQTVEASP